MTEIIPTKAMTKKKTTLTMASIEIFSKNGISKEIEGTL
jgi:hypothetical protein